MDPNTAPIPQTVDEIKAYIRNALIAQQGSLSTASGLNKDGKLVAAEIRDLAKLAVEQAQRGVE